MITLIEALEFGIGQTGNAALRDGFAGPELGFVWSTGTRSTLRLPVPLRPDGVALEITLAPFVHPPRVPGQRIEIAVNGMVVAERYLRAELTWWIDLPPHCLRDATTCEITLRQPDATAPAALTKGGDCRVLGFRLKHLVLLQDSDRAAIPQPQGRLRLDATHGFGCNESTGAMLGEGWGEPEPGYVWAVGRHSVLRLGLPTPGAATTIVLDIIPHIMASGPQRQRIAIGAGGRLLHYISVTKRTCFAIDIPPDMAARELELTFDNIDACLHRPDPAAPDQRELAFMLLRALVLSADTELPPTPQAHLPPIGDHHDDTSLRAAIAERCGLPPERLLRRFESLGFICELGLLQRAFQQEPVGLLRFAGISTPDLIDGLRSYFPGMGRPDKMAVLIRDDEDCGYWVIDTVSTLSFQTPFSSQKVTEDELKRRLSGHQPFLRRKLFEDIMAGEKIFVFQRRETTTRLEAEAVLAALSLWGDPTLLWMAFEPAQVPGSVVRLGPRLLCGFIDQPPGPSSRASDAVLLSVLANAATLCPAGLEHQEK